MVSVTATPDPTTGTMLVQVEQTIARDLFTRVVANGWGNLTTGQAWANTGGAAADYSVNGTQGVVSNGSLNVSRITTFDTGFPDHDTLHTWITPVAVPTGTGPFSSAAIARFTDTNNYYFAHVDVNVGNTVTLRLRKRVLGVNTNISSTVTLPVTHAGSNQYVVRIAVCGSTIRGKAWVTTQTEPDWMVEAQDFDLTTGNRAGQRSILDPGVTNALPVVWQFDNLVTIVGQPIRVFRVVGGTETELRGSPGDTNAQTAAADSATATYWDNEGPFNVSTTYVLRGNCSSANVATSAPVTLTTDFGWLRDPVNPTKNIPIVREGFFDECVDQDLVVFSGLGNPSYENASGIYQIIDARRPRVVSQTRKNYASSLALTSFSLDDTIDLEDLYDPGSVLSLTLPTSYGWALQTFGTDYIAIGTVQQAYIGVDQEVTARSWTMPFWLTGPPADTSEGGTGGNGIGGGDATYDALAASALGATYNSLTASGLTYDQIAAGTGY